MEKRAVIIVFDGDEPSEYAITHIQKEIVSDCLANPEHISIYTLNEKDIVNAMSKSLISADYITKCENGNKAIELLNDEFEFKTEPTTGSFCVAVSLRVMHILDRENTQLATERDKKIKEAIIMLGRGCIYDTKYALSLGYTSEFNKVIRDVYKRIFNEDGTFKK